MNPINQFVGAIDRTRQADLAQSDKAAEFTKIGRAIDHYIVRLQNFAQDTSTKEGNLNRLRLAQAKAYLEKLSRLTKQLAASSSKRETTS
jgi:hypothetical protein